MRIKLIAIATALVALAVGVTTSHAALQNAVGVNISFKKAGGPGNLKVQLINFDGNLLKSSGAPADPTKPLSDADMSKTLYNGNGVVPQRVKQLIVKSTSAKYNSKALPYCKLVNPDTGAVGIPTRAGGMTGAESLTPIKGESNNKTVLKNCPLKSIIGSGSFTAVVGNVGSAYDPGAAGALEGKVYIYNYKPASGDAMGTIALLHVDNPVPANQYLYNGVSKSGVLTANIPARSEIPTNLDASIPAGEVVMTSLNLKLTAPKPAKKNGKPIFTIKSFSNLNVYGRMVRE